MTIWSKREVEPYYLSPRPERRHEFYKLGFILSLVAILAGWIIAFGGMLAMQLFCHEHGDIQEGVKEEYRAGLELQHGLSGFKCSRWLRFEWWSWTLNGVFLIALGLCWYNRRLRQFMIALFYSAAVVTVMNMIFADELLTEYYRARDILKTRGIIAFLGTNLMTAGYFLLAWFGCALFMERVVDRCDRFGGCTAESYGLAGMTYASNNNGGLNGKANGRGNGSGGVQVAPYSPYSNVGARGHIVGTNNQGFPIYESV